MAAPDSLRDKVVVVTGGARGIGRAVVLAFAARGARVAFCYRSDASAAQEVAAAAPDWIRAEQADVGDPAALRAFIAGVQAREGRIDVLVNNAGAMPHKPFLEMSDADWDDCLRVNLAAVFWACRAVLPGMVERHDGVIVNLASIAGQRGSAYHAHYAAAKGGVLALTRSLAREFAAYNVRVNAVAPGRIATDLLLEHAAPGEQERWMADTPAKRLGTAEEIAAAVLFLAEPAAAYVQGATLAVNGGMYIS